MPALPEALGAEEPAPTRLGALRNYRKEKKEHQKRKKTADGAPGQAHSTPAAPPPSSAQPAWPWAHVAPERPPWRLEPFWREEIKSWRYGGMRGAKGPGKGKAKNRKKQILDYIILFW